MDPHQAGMRNLASTGRLNLILRQNAAMAKDSAGNPDFHKCTLTEKDSGIRLSLAEIRQRYAEAALNNNDDFTAWKEALNGSCYEIEFS